jgi:2-polyprenyl-3-methyl-5-hydroxy-6-metoxy-1,4-benzoquinol methylase
MAYDPSMWNERFKGGARPYGVEPSHYLREKVHVIPAGGRVLVPGDGGGRNGVWLARQGFDVTILDYSSEGLEAARRWADEAGVTLAMEQADVTAWPWPSARFDAVVSVYLHLEPGDRARIHRAMLAALKPGGHLILEGFHRDQMAYTSGGPRDPALLFSEEEIRRDWAGAVSVELRREKFHLDESDLHRGPAVLLRGMARV